MQFSLRNEHKMDLRLVKAWERVEKENKDYWKEEELSFNLADVREEVACGTIESFNEFKESHKENWKESLKKFLIPSVAGFMILLTLSNM